MKEEKEVVIALLNWNNSNETLGVLKSLQDVNYKNFSVLVVDNGSSDESVKVLQEFFEIIKEYDKNLIINKENKGFAGGCNTALDWCCENNKEYILFLNNDTEVKEDFLSIMMNAVAQNKDGVVFSPSIYFYDKRDLLWFGGSTDISFAKMNKGMRSSLFMKPLPHNLQVLEIDFASGCCMLCKADELKKVGGFDENFFLYFEDVDLSFRLRNLGHKIYWVPNATIYHKVSATTLTKLGSAIVHYYDVRNSLLLSQKHTSFLFVPYRFLWSLNVIAKQFIKIKIKKNVEVSRMIIRAVLDYYRGNFGKYYE